MKRIVPAPFVLIPVFILSISSCSHKDEDINRDKHEYNGYYYGKYLDRIAFPIGGIGAGMFCIEGTGAISHMSVRNRPEVFNEPCMFAAISVKGIENGTKVLEGPVPDWKKFGTPNSANGSPGTSYGLPRFKSAKFLARFPFALIELEDEDIPLDVEMTGWSPFIPPDADNSSLPVGAIEYKFTNKGSSKLEAVFSYSSRNFMAYANGVNAIKSISNGFVLSENGVKDKPETQGDFAVFTNDRATVVDYCWFRGGWWDPLTMEWNAIIKSEIKENPAVEKGAPGATLFIPFGLAPGETKIIPLMMAWYVPNTVTKYGKDAEKSEKEECGDPGCSCNLPFYKPWYSGKFTTVNDVCKLLDYKL